MENIDLRDQLEQQIHSMKAVWWMRWGIISVFIVLSIIICLGYFVKYPDVIYSEFRFKTNNPSVTLPLIKGAQVHEVLKNSGDFVDKDTDLLIVRNSASRKDVFAVEKAIDDFSFEKDSLLSFFNRFIESDFQLGDEIEREWGMFSAELFEYYKIEQLKTYKSKIQFVKSELAKQMNLRKYYENLIKGNGNIKSLLNEKMKSDSTLYSKGIISRLQYNDNKQEFYKKEEALENNILALKRINLDIVRLQNIIAGYSNDEKGYLLEKQIGIRKSLNKLKSSITRWRERYVLTSPIKGKVTFIQDLKEDSFFEGNVITITPKDKVFYATTKIPFKGAGKIEKGQRVVLKLNDYPYREYGVLKGELLELSEVAGENFYLGKIGVKSNNKSSYEKEIKIKENMSGVSEIITNDRTILGRLFERILYAFKQE